MENHLENFEAIVANSNLVATAGEFVPKSRYPQERYNAGYLAMDQAQGGQSNYFETDNKNGFRPADEKYDYSTSDNAVNHTSETPASSSYNGVETNDDKYKKSNMYYSKNREPKYFKQNQNRWRRTDKEFVKSDLGLRNRASEKVSVLNPHQDQEEVQNYYFDRSKPKPRNYDRSSNYRSFERNGTTYFKNQHWNNHYSDNQSWFRKKRNDQHEDYQPYYSGVRNKNKQYDEEEGGDDDVVDRRRNNNFQKNRSRYPTKNVVKDKPCEEIEMEKEKFNKTNQRERLVDLLTRGVLECLVCCEHVQQNNSTWSCSNCYHVLHLKCIIKWAKSSKDDFGWRCPACQNITNNVPLTYYCFCGKAREPDWNRNDCPHSCGEVCGKTRRVECTHKCVLLCHPGPCPQCTASVTKYCGCKKTSKTIQCFASQIVVCDDVCGKTLNCKIHECKKICHMDDCEECEEVIHQVCFCGKESRDMPCLPETAGVEKFCCEKTCGRQLSCSNHSCNLICHEGDCPKCEFLPELVNRCPCGKAELTTLSENKRENCKDPIPTCDSICGKKLICGQPGNSHTCQSKCHEGACPPCSLETSVKCRCGHMDKMLPCAELNVRADDARCDKRCNKKRSCGKHKCNQFCCIEIDHDCPLPCGRMLQCGSHRCEQTCHRGYCRPCYRASFEELYCECGAEVIFPPVPCGTRRPPCSKPCRRNHGCGHPPTHNCHSNANCPPCTVLTQKYCHGRHELRKAVPCHQNEFSCGMPCNKESDCKRHKCILPCHSGPCLKEGKSCVQPCNTPRPVCGHPCGAPCHEGPCPLDLPCKETVRVTCECGNRSTNRACHDNAKEYHRIATAKLASKMADLQTGQSIDLNDVVTANKKLSYKTLDCNDECKLLERNRRLAIALQIRNPDLSAKLTPRYSDFMKQWAKKDSRFVQMIHDKLTELVQLAKNSKQKSRSYSFESMNRDKRHFVHEYCEHFGCESVAYDQEPKRNVVATALKDKSWLPSMSLLEVLQRENGLRKVPAPVNAKMTSSLLCPMQRTMDVLPVKLLPNHQTEASEPPSSSSQAEAQIDYFDWSPQNSAN